MYTTLELYRSLRAIHSCFWNHTRIVYSPYCFLQISAPRQLQELTLQSLKMMLQRQRKSYETLSVEYGKQPSDKLEKEVSSWSPAVANMCVHVMFMCVLYMYMWNKDCACTCNSLVWGDTMYVYIVLFMHHSCKLEYAHACTFVTCIHVHVVLNLACTCRRWTIDSV